MEKKPFFITSINNREFSDTLTFELLHEFEDFLNKRLQLANYGREVKRIAFTFIAVEPDLGIHEESTAYSRRGNEILLARKLPVSELRNVTSKQVCQLMASVFLASLEQFPMLQLRGFHILRFREDLQGVFEAQGWLMEQEA